MITSLKLVVDPVSQADEEVLRGAAARLLQVDESRVRAVRPRRRSLDARGRVQAVLLCDVYLDDDAPDELVPTPHARNVRGGRRVVVVGCGPAGLFAALRLIERGLVPVVVERGKEVRGRRRDLAAITRHGHVDPDSNYGFGEGGAGTFSDGKLYTRVKDKEGVSHVLRTLVAHGASPDILIDAHPHIGSNLLPKIVAALSATVREAGGELIFGSRVVDLVFDARHHVCGVVTAAGAEIVGEAVILAAGHSARELFELLHRRNITIEPKPFAMGVRIEHPQPLIDSIQYRRAPNGGREGGERSGSTAMRNPSLPPAAYRLATTVGNRGVFSFCMCPGGWVVPAATAPGEVVVNGMSLSRRDSPFANSGLVAAVELDDLQPFEAHGALAGLRYQQSLETMAFKAGKDSQRAPAQRAVDFVAGKESQSLPPCSYQPGLTSAPLHQLLPPALAGRLQEGLKVFASNMRGYLSEEAVLLGVESRTSSPLRIPRDPASCEHPETQGLFPCGEGAGYAGGIVSAALDGVKVANAVAAQFFS